MINKYHLKFISLFLLLVSILILIPEKTYAKTLAGSLRDPSLINAWKFVLGMVNVVAILGLIFIAFVNILRINLEIFNFRRMLPALVIGVILANFSLLICRVIIDFAQMAAGYILGGIDGKDIAAMFGMEAAAIGGGAAGVTSVIVGYGLVSGWGTVFVILIGVIIVFFPAILLFLMALLLYLRIYVIWFLTIISPAAFLGATFVPLSFLWNFWKSWFFKWAFLALISFLLLRIGVELTKLAGSF